MKCLKCDGHNETDCKFSRYSVERGESVCEHPCVLAIEKENIKAEHAKYSAESKLEKYRNAITPFMRNCREIVKISDDIEKEGAKA